MNPYLWRNLLIEAAVLIPVFGAIIGFCHRRKLARPPFALLAGVLAVWACFVAWSVSLSR